MKKSIFLISIVATIYLFGCNHTAKHNNEHPETDRVHEQTDTTQEAEDHYNDESEIQILTLKKQEFRDILKTTGVIIPARENVQSYQAQSSGFIHFVNNNLVLGSAVKKGDVLFEIQGGILTDENYDLKFHEIKLEYEKNKMNYERASELIKDRIISEEKFLEIKTNFKNTESRYFVYLENRNKNGQKVISKTTGHIHQIYVSEGEYINAGKKLATVITRNKLILQADVPQNHFNKLSTFTSASFTTPYSNKVYRSEALNGRLLAYGRSTDDSSFFTPVSFEIDYHTDLLPGSFVEINLLGKPFGGAIVVPKTAIMEEQGKIYVFIHHEDGEYEKVYVESGADDGEFVQILAGLEENQMVVVTGAYHIKLAIISTDLPDTHSH
ncbi:MAG: efflux RND transporter periplasmic adaptor subunit [Bacteroidetes bacterium]|nr:efflux RND transporter periplasmic adaptor subunit [Bacteroidota bacterium]